MEDIAPSIEASVPVADNPKSRKYINPYDSRSKKCLKIFCLILVIPFVLVYFIFRRSVKFIEKLPERLWNLFDTIKSIMNMTTAKIKYIKEKLYLYLRRVRSIPQLLREYCYSLKRWIVSSLVRFADWIIGLIRDSILFLIHKLRSLLTYIKNQLVRLLEYLRLLIWVPITKQCNKLLEAFTKFCSEVKQGILSRIRICYYTLKNFAIRIARGIADYVRQVILFVQNQFYRLLEKIHQLLTALTNKIKALLQWFTNQVYELYIRMKTYTLNKLHQLQELFVKLKNALVEFLWLQTLRILNLISQCINYISSKLHQLYNYSETQLGRVKAWFIVQCNIVYEYIALRINRAINWFILQLKKAVAFIERQYQNLKQKITTIGEIICNYLSLKRDKVTTYCQEKYTKIKDIASKKKQKLTVKLGQFWDLCKELLGLFYQKIRIRVLDLYGLCCTQSTRFLQYLQTKLIQLLEILYHFYLELVIQKNIFFGFVHRIYLKIKERFIRLLKALFSHLYGGLLAIHQYYKSIDWAKWYNKAVVSINYVTDWVRFCYNQLTDTLDKVKERIGVIWTNQVYPLLLTIYNWGRQKIQDNFFKGKSLFSRISTSSRKFYKDATNWSNAKSTQLYNWVSVSWNLVINKVRSVYEHVTSGILRLVNFIKSRYENRRRRVGPFVKRVFWSTYNFSRRVIVATYNFSRRVIVATYNFHKRVFWAICNFLYRFIKYIIRATIIVYNFFKKVFITIYKITCSTFRLVWNALLVPYHLSLKWASAIKIELIILYRQVRYRMKRIWRYTVHYSRLVKEYIVLKYHQIKGFVHQTYVALTTPIVQFSRSVWNILISLAAYITELAIKMKLTILEGIRIIKEYFIAVKNIIYEIMRVIVDNIKSVLNMLREQIVAIVSFAIKQWNSIKAYINEIYTMVKSYFLTIMSWLKQQAQTIKEIIQSVLEFLKAQLQYLKDQIVSIKNQIMNAVTFAIQTMKEFLLQGKAQALSISEQLKTVMKSLQETYYTPAIQWVRELFASIRAQANEIRISMVQFAQDLKAQAISIKDQAISARKQLGEQIYQLIESIKQQAISFRDELKTQGISAVSQMRELATQVSMRFQRI